MVERHDLFTNPERGKEPTDVCPRCSLRAYNCICVEPHEPNTRLEIRALGELGKLVTISNTARAGKVVALLLSREAAYRCGYHVRATNVGRTTNVVAFILKRDAMKARLALRMVVEGACDDDDATDVGLYLETINGLEKVDHIAFGDRS